MTSQPIVRSRLDKVLDFVVIGTLAIIVTINLMANEIVTRRARRRRRETEEASSRVVM